MERLAFSLTMLAFAAFARPALSESRFYFSGAADRADANVDVGTMGGRVKRVTGDDMGYALGAGYRFPKFLAVEATYRDFGRLSGDRNTCAATACTTEGYPTEAVDASSWIVSVTASFRVSARVSGYGKLGLVDWRSSSASGIYNDSRRDAQLGGGFRWTFDTRWALFTEYTKNRADIDDLAVGVQFGFRR